MIDQSGVVDAEALARTYDHQAYSDMWEIVEQYQEVMRYASKHPNKGSAAIASRLELPRSRIRVWTDDGGAPDAVRALRVADKRGWLAADYGDPAFSGLNALVANVFSGGTIVAENYVPQFSLNTRGRDSHVFDALELADVDYRIVDEREGRADEVVPTEDASVLGRTLATLGAPVGQKATQPISLPAYLTDAPDETREEFVACYLENRASEHPSNILTLREERPNSYLDALAALIEDVAGAKVTRSEKNVRLSREATDNIGQIV